METTTNTLQQLIEQRASEKLKQEIAALFQQFRNSPLIVDRSTSPNVQVSYKDGAGQIKWKNGNLDDILRWDDLRNQLYNQWIAEYIEKETKVFVDKVDALSQQIDELKDEVSNIQYNS